MKYSVSFFSKQTNPVFEKVLDNKNADKKQRTSNNIDSTNDLTNSIQNIVNLAITLTDPVDKQFDSEMERLLPSLIKSQPSKHFFVFKTS